MKKALFAVMALALALVACGGSPEGETGAAVRPAAGTAPATDDSVAAVLQSGGTPVAQLRFVVEGRPVAGAPFSVRLLVSAPAAVPALQMSVESATLQVESGVATLALAGGGVAVPHVVSLTAAQEGLAELSVRLRTDAGAEAPETVFVVPVLVEKPAAG